MGIEFNQDGTIGIDFGDRSLVVPSPTIGTYRKLRNRLGEIFDQEKILRKARDATAESSPERETAQRELSEFVAEWSINWLNELLDSQLGDSETWPAWMSAPEIPSRFITHWQTLPLASGAPKTGV